MGWLQPAVPFEAVTAVITEISLTRGITLDGLVQVATSGDEGNIQVGAGPVTPTLGVVGPTNTVPITGWSGTPPILGDAWSCTGAFAVMAAVAPTTGFAGSSGLVVA